jgi:DNA-binding LacI/PurR family transcriptional regulator
MTVSRVINEHPAVKEATRSRVQYAIRELGFRPNRAARALAASTDPSVTVLTSNTTLYGRAALLQGIEEAARAVGMTVEIAIIDSARPADVQATIDRTCAPNAGGVIVIAYDLAGVRALRAVPAGIPLAAAVEITNTHDARRIPTVTFDDQVAAQDATSYLLELGHRTVHYLAVPSSTSIGARLRGWRGALQAAGAAVPEVVEAGWSAESGYRAALALAADPSVTAVLCGNDDVALGTLHAMREAGRSVPEDVSVIGFDDVPQSAYYAPPLTTVRLDFVGLGRDCVTLLRHTLDPAASASLVAAVPELVVRASTAAPASARAGRSR